VGGGWSRAWAWGHMQGDQIAGNKTGTMDRIAYLSLRAGNRHGYGLIEAVFVQRPSPASSSPGRCREIDAEGTKSPRCWHQRITASSRGAGRPYVDVVSRHQTDPGLARSGR